MNSSKKCSKLGVKLLASVLSVITLCPGITPYVNAANSKGLRSGNYITRKVKNVGLRADSFIKRKYIELCSLIKNNPKTTIAVGTTVGLVIIGTISVVCYKSHKDKKGAEKPGAEKPGAEEPETKESKAEQQGAGESEEPNMEKIVTGEQKSEDSKAEQLTKKKQSLISSYQELCKNIKDAIAISKCSKEYNDAIIQECISCIKELVERLENNNLENNVSIVFKQKYADFYVELKKIEKFANIQNLSQKFEECYKSVAEKFEEIRKK